MDFSGKLDDIGLWNRALTQPEITNLYNSNSVCLPSYVPTNGLQSWYPFCGNANDDIGTNNGTVNGATLTTDRYVNANSAYSYNGTSNSITFPQLFVFNQPGDASLSIWINKSTLPNIQGSFLYSTTSTIDANRFNFYFQTLNNSINLDYRQPVTLHQLNINNNFINNAWQHVVFTRTGNVYSLYINGLFINSSTDTSPNLPTAVGWVLGADPTGVMDFSGKLDDIGLWNRALTQPEITSLYNGTTVNINTIIKDYSFSIFPNPTKNTFTVAGLKTANISIYNQLGSLVKQQTFENETISVNIADLPQGIYMVEVLAEGKRSLNKLVKE